MGTGSFGRNSPTFWELGREVEDWEVGPELASLGVKRENI